MRRELSVVKVAIFLCFVCLFWLLPIHAHADGGAPNLAYVAGSPQGISVIDIAQQHVKNTLSVPGNPQTIILSVDGRLLYVTQPALKRVAIIATATKSTLCTASYPGHPSLLTLDPGTNTLYVAGTDAYVVDALDPLTCAIRHTVTTNGHVAGIAIAIVGSGTLGGDGNQLWVANALALTIFDASGKQLSNVPMPDGPQYLSIPAGPTAYVTTQQGTVDAVDLHLHHVYPHLLTGGSFGPMDYSAADGDVYVPDREHQLVAVLAPINPGAFPHEPIRVLSMPAPPESIAITSDGQLGFVALQNGTVVMLDIPGRQVINTFHVGGQPHFIITGLYPSYISLTPQQSFLLNAFATLSHYIAAIVVALVAIISIIVNRRKTRRSH